jgi:hypothetical protein
MIESWFLRRPPLQHPNPSNSNQSSVGQQHSTAASKKKIGAGAAGGEMVAKRGAFLANLGWTKGLRA